MTAHPSESAFLRQIGAHPGERWALLVYADWLDDRGRACEAAALRVPAGHTTYWHADRGHYALWADGREYVSADGDHWAAAVGGDPAGPPYFRNGRPAIALVYHGGPRHGRPFVPRD